MFSYAQVGDLGYADELGNYAEYSGAPNEEETLQYARSLIDVSTQPQNQRICRWLRSMLDEGLFSVEHYNVRGKDCCELQLDVRILPTLWCFRLAGRYC